MAKPEIFISYAWGGESEHIVNEICVKLGSEKYTIIRDKIDLGYKGNIQEFMQRIGTGNYIIVIISDKYLKSDNCMYEMLQIYQNKDVYERIFPVLLQDARIYDETSRIEYLVYWDEKNAELKKHAEALKNPVGKEGVYKTINLYASILQVIDEITMLLRKMNVLTPVMHRSSNFAELSRAIEDQYSVDFGVKTINSELVPIDFIGLNIKNYIITEYINSGGFGSVYKAKHASLGRIVALKISHQITRGYRNIKDVIAVGINGLKHLNHSNIVKIEDLFEESIGGDRRLVIVMEYIQGGTLKDLKKEGLSEIEVKMRIELFIKVCNAISYAHLKKYKNSVGQTVTGLMHGDIKPTNVLLTTTGEPKVMDFMFVDLHELLKIETKVPDYLVLQDYGTMAIGTKGYMAPEQMIQGEVDEQTDIFALGILLYELFSSTQFNDDKFSGPEEIKSKLSAVNSHVPAILSDIIFKATHIDRDKRYSSVQELIDAINGSQ